MRLEPRVHVSAESAYDLEIATTLPERVGSGRCLVAGPVPSMGQSESVSALKSGGEVRPNSDGQGLIRRVQQRSIGGMVRRQLSAISIAPAEL